jgi:hypothetical protein
MTTTSLALKNIVLDSTFFRARQMVATIMMYRPQISFNTTTLSGCFYGTCTN